MKRKYVLEISMDSYNLECVKRDYEELNIKEWAEDCGFTVFFTKSGVCFRNDNTDYVPSYSINCDGTVCVSLGHGRSDEWDLWDTTGIELRIL